MRMFCLVFEVQIGCIVFVCVSNGVVLEFYGVYMMKMMKYVVCMFVLIGVVFVVYV